ncbi:MAG: FprA family A-type flavoprotein, partial [Acidobacteriota bacterium]
RMLAPRAEILGSLKTQAMLKGFFGIQDGVRVVGDGDSLSLGAKTLRFVSTPFVHWPETIMTYETSERILFSCDGFGGYGTLRGFLFDDECRNLDFYISEALRYYANIIANYSPRVLDAIGKLSSMPIDIVAPSHGLVWRGNPRRIIDLYKKWAEYGSGEVEPGITLIYGSMYGYTEIMMNSVAQGINLAGVDLEVFDAARTHVSYILPSLWTKKGVMIGAPTYEVKLFPPVAEILNMAVNKRVVNRRAAFFGSYGWSGGALRELRKIIEPAKWELKEVFEFTGYPTKEDLQKGVELGTRFAEQLKSAA